MKNTNLLQIPPPHYSTASLENHCQLWAGFPVLYLRISNEHTYTSFVSSLVLHIFLFSTVKGEDLERASSLPLHIHTIILILSVPPVLLYQSVHEMTIQGFY